MAKLLVVDDEVAMRRLIRMNLSDEYEIVDTGEPEHALALALEHKPDAILLDLRMPKYSGFELCQMFTSFGSTQLIPVLVISGEAGSSTKEFCRGSEWRDTLRSPWTLLRFGRSLPNSCKRDGASGAANHA